jgi:hypothetical protein
VPYRAWCSTCSDSIPKRIARVEGATAACNYQYVHIQLVSYRDAEVLNSRIARVCVLSTLVVSRKQVEHSMWCLCGCCAAAHCLHRRGTVLLLLTPTKHKPKSEHVLVRCAAADPAAYGTARASFSCITVSSTHGNKAGVCERSLLYVAACQHSTCVHKLKQVMSQQRCTRA